MASNSIKSDFINYKTFSRFSRSIFKNHDHINLQIWICNFRYEKKIQVNANLLLVIAKLISLPQLLQ